MPSSIFRLTAVHKVFLACLLLVPFCAASNHDDDWRYDETRTDARDFVSGGTLHMHLSVGDLEVRRGDTNQIRLRYTVKSRHEKNVKETRVDFDVHGNDASIEIHAPGSNTQADVELEVPRETNLDVHQKVGDLTVKEIDGDKDLDLSVGDIRIINPQSGYRTVRARTGIGDVNGGDDYGETSGWLGKTLTYHGEGKHDLRAHVSVGDITLEEK